MSTNTIHFPAFHVMTKPIGPICNLDCSYCFYLEKEKMYPESQDFRMSDEVLETFIKQKIEAQQISSVSFTWQGGEPTLLGLDFFQRVVELQQKYAGDKRISNQLQTNGLLLDEHWGEFLRSNRFLVGISIDGPRDLHDTYRLGHNGLGSFDRVMSAMELLKQYEVDFNTLTVVHSQNGDHALEVYHFLKDIGSNYMQFIPIVERSENGELTDWSVAPAQYGHFLTTIFDEWVRQDVGERFVQSFEVALEAWMGQKPSLCIFNRTCGTELALEHNGDVYSCDHFVDTENLLGNITDRPLQDIVNSEKQIRFGQAKQDLCSTCRSCEVRFVCHGDCPKHRFVQVPGEEQRISYLCESYLHFFTHIQPYMQFMVNELREQRPPANIMAYLASGKTL